jgi:hypothetical protein
MELRRGSSKAPPSSLRSHSACRLPTFSSTQSSSATGSPIPATPHGCLPGRRAPSQRAEFAAMGHLRSAVRIQALHMAEHVALTSTVLFGSRAIGVSTFFGLVDGSGTTWWRVWFHFLINLVATSYAGLAVLERCGSRAVTVREADAGCATWRETALCQRNGWGQDRPRAMSAGAQTSPSPSPPQLPRVFRRVASASAIRPTVVVVPDVERRNRWGSAASGFVHAHGDVDA